MKKIYEIPMLFIIILSVFTLAACNGDIKKSSLDELTTPSFSLEAYIGQWENDTVYAQLMLTDMDYKLKCDDGISSGAIIKSEHCLLIGKDNQKLTVTDDGGLKLENMEGTFYPIENGRGASSPINDFVGSWVSSSGATLEITEDGTYAFYDGESFFKGDCIVTEGYLAFSDHIVILVDGQLTVSDIEGVFERSTE